MNAKLKKAVLAAAIMSTPLAASAADLVGGGASLPALAYVGDSFTGPSPQARFSTTIVNPTFGVEASDDSIFDVYANQTSNNASYCQTGSGTGKRVLLGAGDPNGGDWDADRDCLDYSQTPLGFSAPTGQAVPDFAGSDAPLTADDINTFTSGPREAARTNLVQVPALGALLALPINLSGGYVKENLTTDQVCGIYAGIYRSWDQVGLSTNNDPIDVVYRSDDSGTVFAFTQYLASTCNGRTIGNVTIPTNFFQTNELFEDAIPVAPSVLYAEASPASGNGGIITEVEANTWSIGFANYSNVDAENQGSNTLGYATVDNHDPAGTVSITVNPTDILIDTVLGPNGSDGLPSTVDLSTVDDDLDVECMAVVDPAVQLDQTYPIVAFTNLLTYTNSNASPSAVQALFTEVTYGTRDQNGDPAFDLPAGYARIDSTVVPSIISSCIN